MRMHEKWMSILVITANFPYFGQGERGTDKFMKTISRIEKLTKLLKEFTKNRKKNIYIIKLTFFFRCLAHTKTNIFKCYTMHDRFSFYF